MPLLDRMGQEKPTSSSFKGGQEEREPWEQGRGKMPDHFTFLWNCPLAPPVKVGSFPET